MSRQSSSSDLIVGGEPRVDLLPPEVRATRRGALARRGLIALLLLCIVVALGGYFLASAQATAANDRLTAEQSRTTELLTAQQKYVTARQATVAISSAAAAARIGMSTEIDWSVLLQEIQATLPGSLTGVTIDTATPIKAFPQPTVPLATGRIATITLVAAVDGIPAADAWLTSLRDIAGVADVSVGSIQSQDGSKYTVNVVIAINQDALMNPLTTKDSK